MALIAIPIGAAAEYRSAMRSALRALSFISSDAGTSEPLVVLTSKSDGWGSDSSDQTLADRGLLAVGEGSLADRIREAVNTIRAQRLRAAYAGHDRATADERHLAAAAPIVFMPIIRLRKAGVPQALVEMRKAIDLALEPLTTGLMQRELSASAFAYIPWVQLEPELAGTPPHKDIFGGPARVRGGKAVPILHVHSDPLAAWEESGRVRLIADLLALYGFSNSSEAASWLSPNEWERPSFHSFSSSFVELPMARARRRHALKEMERQLLPPSVEVASDDGREALRKVIQLVNDDDVTEKDFADSRGPLGVATELSPDREDFMGISANRRAEHVHDHAVRAVREAVAHRVRAVAQQKLGQFRVELLNAETDLADRITKAVTGDGKLPLNESIQKALQLCDAYTAALPRPIAETSDDDVDAVVTQVVNYRASWVGQEERLYDDGSAVPSKLGLILSASVIALGAGLLAFVAVELLRRAKGWSEVWSYLSAVVGGAAAAFIYYRSREAAVSDYFAAWHAYEDSLRSAVKAAQSRLLRIANRRLKAMKIAALPGLERALRALRVRLHTERSGLVSILRKEIESVPDDEPQRPHAGWFRVGAIDEQTELPRESLDYFRELLRKVVTLHDWPRPLKLSEHFEAIDLAVRRCAENVSTDRVAATHSIQSAVRFATDARVTSDFEHRRFSVQREGKVQVFVPASVHDIVAQELSTFVWPVPELVVVSRVRSFAVVDDKGKA